MQSVWRLFWDDFFCLDKIWLRVDSLNGLISTSIKPGFPIDQIISLSETNLLRKIVALFCLSQFLVKKIAANHFKNPKYLIKAILNLILRYLWYVHSKMNSSHHLLLFEVSKLVCKFLNYSMFKILIPDTHVIMF